MEVEPGIQTKASAELLLLLRIERLVISSLSSLWTISDQSQEQMAARLGALPPPRRSFVFLLSPLRTFFFSFFFSIVLIV